MTSRENIFLIKTKKIHILKTKNKPKTGEGNMAYFSLFSYNDLVSIFLLEKSSRSYRDMEV
jgi:hypothetical protein